MQKFSRYISRALFNVKFNNQKQMSAFYSTWFFSVTFLCIHIIFAIMFAIMGIYRVAALNIFSVICYSCMLIFNNSERNKEFSHIAVLEVSLYCIISTALLGWDSGTFTFLLILIYPCYTLFSYSKTSTAINISTISAALLICCITGKYIEPTYYIERFTVVPMMNIFMCLLGSVLILFYMHTSTLIVQEYYEQIIEDLTGEANKDPLTQLWNRRYAEQALQHIFTDNTGKNETFLAMVDIDVFKRINDTHGHNVGDEVLKFLATSIVDQFRKSDIAIRWGGEEFLIVITGANKVGAKKALENFRSYIESSVIRVGDLALSITITIGFCECCESSSLTSAVNKSDIALYWGKENGRNRVVDYSDLSETDKQTMRR